MSLNVYTSRNEIPESMPVVDKYDSLMLPEWGLTMEDKFRKLFDGINNLMNFDDALSDNELRFIMNVAVFPQFCFNVTNISNKAFKLLRFIPDGNLLVENTSVIYDYGSCDVTYNGTSFKNWGIFLNQLQYDLRQKLGLSETDGKQVLSYSLRPEDTYHYHPFAYKYNRVTFDALFLDKINVVCSESQPMKEDSFITWLENSEVFCNKRVLRIDLSQIPRQIVPEAEGHSKHLQFSIVESIVNSFSFSSAKRADLIILDNADWCLSQEVLDKAVNNADCVLINLAHPERYRFNCDSIGFYHIRRFVDETKWFIERA